MKDYDVTESWTGLFTIRFSDGELLLCCKDLGLRAVFRTSKGPLGLRPQSNFSQTDFSPKMSRQPEVLWAQRSEKVYLTISLPAAKDVSLKCEPDGVFNFSAVGVNGDSFSVTVQIFWEYFT
ncbi:hypothetical protein P3L10_019530 [Capsicum annuum]